jgi:GxxExxY protein
MELAQAGMPFVSQAPIPIIDKDRTISLGFRTDILIDDAVILAIKAVTSLLPAQLGAERVTVARQLAAADASPRR